MSDSQDKLNKSSESDDSSADVSPMDEDIHAILAAYRVGPPLSPIRSEKSPSDTGDLQSEDSSSCASNISAVATKGGDTDESNSEKSPSVATEMEISDHEESLQKRGFSEVVKDATKDSGTSNLGTSSGEPSSSSPESSVPAGEVTGKVPRTVSTSSADELSNFSDMSISEKSHSSVPPDGEDETSNMSDVSVPRVPMGRMDRNPVDAVTFRFGQLDSVLSARNPTGEEPGNVFSDASVPQYSENSEDASNPAPIGRPIGRQEDLGNVSSDASVPQFSGDSGDSSMMDAILQRQRSNRAPVPAELDECLSSECFTECNLSSFAADDLNVRSETVVKEIPASSELERPSTSRDESHPGGSSSGGVGFVSARNPLLMAMLTPPPELPEENHQSSNNPSNVSTSAANLTSNSTAKSDGTSSKSSKPSGSETSSQVTSSPKIQKDTPKLCEPPSSHIKSKFAADEGSKGVDEATQKSESSSTGASGIDSKSTRVEGEIADKKATKRGITENEKTGHRDRLGSSEGSPTKKPLKKCTDPAEASDTKDISVPPPITKDLEGRECDALTKQDRGKAKDFTSPTKKAPKRGITNPDIEPASTSTVKVNVESVEPSEIAIEQSERPVTEKPVTDSVSPSKKSRQTAAIETQAATSSGGVAASGSSNLKVPTSSVTKERSTSTRTPRKPRAQPQTPVSERITRSRVKKEKEKKEKKEKDEKEKDEKEKDEKEKDEK